jgi:two-component system OmpR family sensor kinase
MPVRLRLTLAFAGVMALVLAATGAFLFLRFQTELDNTLRHGLRSRAVDVGALVQQADSGLRDSGAHRPSEPGADFAQILDARSGAVFDATPGLTRRPLLTGAELRAAARATILLERTTTPTATGRTRLLATPVHAQGRRLIVVVGASLEDRDGALATLRAQLLVGGPAALVLASLAGYGLTSAALRPVSRMLARLEDGLARERAFTADAGHELRTPLTMLIAELQLMARDRPAGEAFDVSVGAAGEEAQRLATLLDDLLVLARADAGRLPLAVAAVPADELVAAVARRYAAPGAGIGTDVPAGLHLWGDRGRLERALGNLVGNALRHAGGRVTIAAERRDGMVELHVRDDGPGFPPAFLPHAFDRFARPDPGHADGGSGLGLAIADAIARGHGGGAHALNRPGGGADVWISVPAARYGARTPEVLDAA